MKLNAKVIGISVAALIVAGGIGFSIGDPEALAGLAGSLTGAVYSEDTYTRYYGMRVSVAGQDVPGVQSLTGCSSYVTRAETTMSTEKYSTATVGKIATRPCTLVVTVPLSTSLRAWISDTQKGTDLRRDVHVVLLNREGREAGGFVAPASILTGMAIAPLDADVADTKLLATITFQPSRIEGFGATLGTSASSSKALIYPNMFRVDLGTTLMAAKVENLSFTVPVMEDTSGDTTHVSYLPGRMQWSNPVVTVYGWPENPIPKWEADSMKGMTSLRTLEVSVLDGAGTPVQTLGYDRTAFVEYAPIHPAAGTAGSLHKAKLTVAPSALVLVS